MPCELSKLDSNEFIYFGDIQQKSAPDSKLNMRESEEDDKISISSLNKQFET